MIEEIFAAQIEGLRVLLINFLILFGVSTSAFLALLLAIFKSWYTMID